MKKKLLLIPFLYCANFVQAAGLDYSIGVGVSNASIKYEDDNGTTASDTLVFPVRLFGELKMDKINKFQAGFRTFDFDIDATRQGDMGATFEGSQIDAAWLHQVRLSRNLRPWFGIGTRISFMDVTGRHRIDKEGFLVERYAPSSDTVIAGLVLGYYEWAIGRSGWYLDTSVTHEIPVSGDTFEGTGVGVGVKVEF